MLENMFFALLTDPTNAENVFNSMIAPVLELLDAVVTPAIFLVGSLGAVYCILLGVKLAKAEEPQEHQKAKNALKNAIVGFALIFVMIAALKLTLPALTSWMQGVEDGTVELDASGKPVVK